MTTVRLFSFLFIFFTFNVLPQSHRSVSLSKQNIDDYTVCKTKYYRTLFTFHVHGSVK